MGKEKAYRSISELTSLISERMKEVDHGHCTLAELEELLADIRELEERVIVIRYKGMERLKYLTIRKVKEPSPHAPELPLDEVTELEEKAESVETLDLEADPNQISLIDSIEEISKESSINESLKSETSQSVAQELESQPLESIMKAINLNLKMGLIKDLFSGDEEGFRNLVTRIDSSEGLDAASELLKTQFPDAEVQEGKLFRKLYKLIERRFS